MLYYIKGKEMPPKKQPPINFTEISNELHKQTITNYATRRVVINDIDEIWAIDLVEMPKEWAQDNDGKTLILSVIDCFSKYAWLVIIDNKTAQTIIKAMLGIFTSSGRRPEFIWCDRGSEFINKDFKKQILTKYNIKMYHTYNNFKSSIVERFNRTMKLWTFKALDASNTKNWVNLIPQIIDKYNNKRHSSIKMTPIKASKAINKEKVFHNLYYKMYSNILNEPKAESKFKVDDIVRVSRVKSTFEKEADQTFTRETFQIRKVLDTTPITYLLSELVVPVNHMRPKKDTYQLEPMDGSFYTEELQLTDVPDNYAIEKIIKTKTIKRIEYSLVKFLGWDTKYSLWIPTNELQDL